MKTYLVMVRVFAKDEDSMRNKIEKIGNLNEEDIEWYKEIFGEDNGKV